MSLLVMKKLFGRTLLSWKFSLPCDKRLTLYSPRPRLPTFSLMFITPLPVAATSSPSVSSFRLLDNHSVVVTVSTWGFSRILGYWPCNALFFHFSSVINFKLDLNMCFVALAFSKADFILSVLKLSWHCYFPLGLSSILGYWNGFRSFKFKHLLCILPIFVLQMVIKPYCCCFECCFYLNQTPSSIFSRDVQPFHICFRVWHLVHVQRFECFCANLLQFWDFPVKDDKTILLGPHDYWQLLLCFCHWAQFLRSILLSYYILSLSSLSFCCAEYHHFHLHPGICIRFPGPALVLLCHHLLLYVQFRPVYLSWS